MIQSYKKHFKEKISYQDDKVNHLDIFSITLIYSKKRVGFQINDKEIK